MPNTPNLSIPYPGALEVPNIPLDLQELAEGVDEAVGGTWQTYTPSFGSGWTIGNATVQARYKAMGKTIHFNIYIRLGSTTSITSSTLGITLPVTRQSTDYEQYMGAGVAKDANGSGLAARRLLDVIITEGGGSTVTILTPDGTGLTPTNPWTWATGDKIQISGTYERA